ncbi:30S ribosomal protein S2 [Candidatus Roizmanbacteria bacterium RIFCSPLOWO2_02_FULL_37_19]|uniref:Small ribosomal subunit protein uS2 n=1 Tax=Candidatus Roizmanbacteria bacterium RIFCSPHIGHO2_02_FULL_37_24 TaxID=1802037 RepID=A0A1F7GV04_9BACT|nr:MAG: 30S ribosomal protein S2 [Candidatus Roizmanbacteria bacterium RIFCSPHIGHO2_01_FULL_38_41]OGK22947.1 MAG: 30S ribosomal protein S2 [Candidatus Roizmanbacteria bacterium RIFCSPHIGHO2_02_FULL_37_24]OGK33599.1 MAG: 30S ribosomal protein S2 [Candidatus Roizmanbacteria bacterium RIFCSPHIGHO2_12_FULL_37_23]OGK44196.1 MAG: 30S ribosomal protein S2 [Candidatus Roizmanbacteria bacterium RIFCSPLOWO2_01_FULL_37_57]OGK55251.1 MAG: 30S ribosomal protein S2 [Candidatus Roizmanbacteria bacterium RIFCS
MTAIDPQKLLQYGLHLGHKKQKVHPKSKKFIHSVEKGVSIIDLFKTAEYLDQAIKILKKFGSEGKTLLYVATKKVAREPVSTICKENNIFYITNKWVGGFLTNFTEIKKNIERMNTMREEQKSGAWAKLPKHERIALEKKINRIASIYDGVAQLDKLPDVLCILDIRKEQNAVIEAQIMNIPTIAVVDTNVDPDLVSYPIPANDDAVVSIKYITEELIKAYDEGRKNKEKADSKEEKKIKKT